jgi:mannitol 2-dehydrogenase
MTQRDPSLGVLLSSAAIDKLPEAVKVPTYDRSAVRPGIVHFGVGGFHRSHQAMYIDRLLELGEARDWGICGVGLMPADQGTLKLLADQDNLYTLMVKDPRGGTEIRVIGSIISSLYAPDDPGAVLAVLTDPQVRIVSLTITEGGYNVDPNDGEFDATNDAVLADLRRPGGPQTVFGYVVEALARRRALDVPPFAVVSCDNIQSNGTVACKAFSAYAELRDPELAQWIRDEVPFPSSMVDRITPVTTESDVAELYALGLDDQWPVVSEPFTQWVLEDAFPAGRPEWDRVGVQMTSDVVPYELMKLRLLNVGHQVLAYAGHLAGYTYVHDAAADPVFAAFLRGYMQLEARPTLLPVEGIDLDDYMDTLLDRFTNPHLGDTIARLCAWGSDRIPKWHVPVVQQNLATGGPIEHSATLIAAWARYAEGVDEQGRPIDIVDAAADEIRAAAQGRLRDPLAFLRNRRLFGNLVDSSRFADEYLRASASFHEVGARATLAGALTARPAPSQRGERG